MFKKLRSYFDDENVKFAQKVKEAEFKVAAAKEKVCNEYCKVKVHFFKVSPSI